MIADRIIGHRGVASLAAENTLGSIRQAARLGLRWIELDTTLLGDNTPVLSHDNSLDRCTDQQGLLQHLSLPELNQINATALFQDSPAEPLPTLQQALTLVQQLGLNLNLEIKGFDLPPDQVAEVICNALEQHWDNRCSLLISSFDFEVLLAVRRLDPCPQIGVLFEAIPDDWLGYMQAVDAASLHCDWEQLSFRQAQAVKQAGYDLYCYTCNDTEQARRLFSIGVDGIFTDCPQDLLEQV
ncbi:glycerophosphodiester phosphodiesterase family protein [Marinobacterium jannaschii]|uniref:glycerophosphodiester phosphodiesterase family protein n=1 Tax=Marinobacterium jannaschii TaxID=64970 RepID=UPI000487C5CE|nr:glycerophosphodiester phosphodiesterase family protein [Marinobacterium jannaschii]